MKKVVSQLGHGLAWIGGSLVVVACLAYGFSLGNFEGMLQIAVMVYIWNRERINEFFREYVPGRQSVKMTRLDEIMKKAGR